MEQELPSISIFVTSKPMLEAVHVQAIIASNQGLDAIVNTGKWGRYTSEAKEYANSQGVSLFNYRQLLGALERDDEEFPVYERTAMRVARQSISRHSKVVRVEDVALYELRVHRKNLSTVRVAFTEIYILGIADLREILEEFPNIDAIVNLSLWNYYTKEAKGKAKEYGIGLFELKEFLGALNYAGDSFISYGDPEAGW
ncbi:hypothetical protein [Streptosporangium sp. NPDC051022]|uniref:hypothetical protein n=1 Tax=Streptosporangium sp. NPDC051022 TaxID=3155752 RepID=UPI00342A89FA